MGVVGAAFGLGFIFGPAIGGLLAGSDPVTADFKSPALAAAGLSALALILTTTLLPESLSPEIRKRNAALPPADRWQQLRAALAAPRVGRLILLGFLSTFVFAGMETIFAIWSRRQFGWGPEQNGYLFAFVGLISAVIQGGLVGRLSRRWGEGRLVAGGGAALALGMLLIPQATSLLLLVPAMVIVAAGFSLMTPSLNSLVSLQVDQAVQGGTMGVARSASTLARVLGPVWAGVLFHHFGKDWPFYAGFLIMVAVVLISRALAGDDKPSCAQRSKRV
jgi:DHA1 family tetracycline resistance protein-like MFS transporter